MRKCSLYIISSVLLLSCKTQKVLPDSFVSVYKSNRIGNIYPEYIILKSKTKTFEKFSPGLDYGVIGVWEASNDTIFLLPKYQYSQRENVCNFSELTNDDLSLATIPQKYMIKDNTLIDITDYTSVMKDFPEFNIVNQTIYKNVTNSE